ncbi:MULTISPECIES: hypothetical protein [Paraburkholderia]|mgnify:CR=1 FL=1|jgi:hypothetical protein|uniref:hypothetical protein n=1 Tax=Paraburkholderia TaxID=1822464 RepID=UPI0009F2068B|nr:hypothetical protein [Paraburkholderia terricola]AXE95400.1 hypothetical protein CUJ90_24100 [Paraburkholderia terricola]ORC52089.1 hypothetical protein B2G74_05525 [Burkholderia sp. A27]
MKTFNKTSRSIIATLLAGGTLLAAGSAFAQERVVIGNGPAPVVYGQPHMMPVGVSIDIGWHGDRYYDGRRYWDHDEWMRHHPRDYDPRHHGRDDHNDHRPPPRY